MRFVIQRVKNASVTVEEEIIGQIGQGFLMLVGVCNEDTIQIADKMIKWVMVVWTVIGGKIHG